MEKKITRRKSIADVHFHPWNYAQQGTDPLYLLDAMNEMKMRYTVLAPIPTSLLLRCGNCTHKHGESGHQHKDEVPSPNKLDEAQQKAITELWESYNPATGLPAINKQMVDQKLVPNYYISELEVRNAFKVSSEDYERLIKEDAPLYYDTGVDGHTARAYLELTEEDRAKFDPMITGLALGDMRASEKLIMKLYDNPGVFTGVGEITVFKEWVQRKVQGEMQADLTSQQCALLKLMKTCGTIGMPVVLHCDVGSMFWEKDNSSDKATQDHFENMKAFLSHPDCQKTTIIWAHAGGLGKYARIRPGHLKNLEKILSSDDCKHVHFDLSWDTVAEQLLYDDNQLPVKETSSVNEEKLQELVNLINKYPYRFLFGSDSLSPNTVSIWKGTETTYHELFVRLGDQVSNALRIGNYERLIVGARRKVRLWERHCLPYAAIAILRRSDNQRPPHVIEALSKAIQDAIKHGESNIAKQIEDTQAMVEAFRIPPSFLKRAATAPHVGNNPPWNGNDYFNEYLKQAEKATQQ